MEVRDTTRKTNLTTKSLKKQFCKPLSLPAVAETLFDYSQQFTLFAEAVPAICSQIHLRQKLDEMSIHRASINMQPVHAPPAEHFRNIDLQLYYVSILYHVLQSAVIKRQQSKVWLFCVSNVLH